MHDLFPDKTSKREEYTIQALQITVIQPLPRV